MIRIATVLKECVITFNELKKYESYVNVTFQNVNQSIDEETYLKIKAIVNNKTVRNEIIQKEKQQFLEKFGGFPTKRGIKLIASINWYYDVAKKGEYGFAQHIKLNSIFFRGEVVQNIDPKNLKKNDEVVIHISSSQLLNLKKVKASKVYLLSNETDLIFLTHTALLDTNKSSSSAAFNVLLNTSYVLKENQKKSINTCIQNFFSTKSITYNSAKRVLAIIKKLNLTLTQEQQHKIETALCTDADYLGLIELFQKHQITFNYSLLNNKQQVFAWLNNYTNSINIDVVYETVLLLKEKEKQEKDPFFKAVNGEQNIINEIFKKLSENEITNLFYKAHYQIDVIDNINTLNNLLGFIKYINNIQLKNECVGVIYAKASDFIRLILFVEDYTNKIDYHNCVLYTAFLNVSQQKLFFKKILMLIEIGELSLNIEDLQKITTYTYEDNELAKQIDNVGVDFTLSIVLKIIDDLQQNKITTRQTMFEIIANQIKSPKDLLVIEGFFPKCTGRTIIEETVNNNNSSDDNKYYKKETEWIPTYTNDPTFTTYCDGRKALDKKGKVMLSEKGGFEFWWCQNTPCYKPCRSDKFSDYWRDYTLQDVFRILYISYQENQYEVLLGVINKVNRFLEHLTCTNCNHILRPKGKENYGFHRVSTFNCTNEKCKNPDDDVYLTHCISGICENIVDSRKTVKCKPASFKNNGNCGWYICDYCFSCCSTEKLTARKNIKESFGQNYNCHVEGHKDKGIICCNKCGSETKPLKANIVLFKKQLNWFIKKSKDSVSDIVSSGQRDDGKWWFRWRQGNLSQERFKEALQNLKSNGFQVPNINSNDKIQFVAEPFDELKEIPTKFLCEKCDHVIDIEDKDKFDNTRKKIIKSSHLNIFTLKNKM